MRSIPSNRPHKVKFLSDGVQEIPILILRPAPAGLVRYEIDGKSVLVWALPWPRFTTPFLEQLQLPLRSAYGLERYETGLRDAGLITPDQYLSHRDSHGLKFRVQNLHFAYSTCHSDFLFVKGEVPHRELLPHGECGGALSSPLPKAPLGGA